MRQRVPRKCRRTDQADLGLRLPRQYTRTDDRMPPPFPRTGLLARFVITCNNEKSELSVYLQELGRRSDVQKHYRCAGGNHIVLPDRLGARQNFTAARTSTGCSEKRRCTYQSQ